MAQQYFLQGFYIGTGISLALIIFVILPYHLLRVFSWKKIFGKVKSYNEKLSLDMMYEYRDYLVEKEIYDELKDFSKYLEDLENKKPINDFFTKYHVIEKVILNKESPLFNKSEKKYLIRRK